MGNCLQVGGSTGQEAVYAISVGEELARLRAALSAAGDVAYEWDLTADSIKWSGDVAKACGNVAEADLEAATEKILDAVRNVSIDTP